MLHLAVVKRPNFLQIGIISGFGLCVGMGDLVSGDRLLSTNFTLFCHKLFLIRFGMLSKWPLNVKTKQTNQALGRAGEELALNHLKRLGFKIKECNFRTRFGEIDIVATKSQEYYFVEVKTRNGSDYGNPIESFPFYRVERLKKMVMTYATRHRLTEKMLHVSLLGIDCAGPEPKITFLPDIVT